MKARVTDAHDGRADVQRYEQLRAQALDGGPAGFRLGLLLLERRGVAAWTRACKDAAPTSEGQRTAASVAWLPSTSNDLVGALASMALARVAVG